MTLSRRTLAVALGLTPLATPAILRAQTRNPAPDNARTLADTMAGDSRFTRFLDIITRVSAVEDFRQPTQMTVFAPVDQAFAGAPAGILQDLLGNSESGNNQNSVERTRVMALLQYHMVPGRFTLQDFSTGERRLRTVNGADLLITPTANSINIRNPAPAQQAGAFGAAGAQMSAVPAEVVIGPILASNGVIFPLNQVLWP